MTNSSFASNHAEGSGGAIYGLGNLAMSIADSFFEGNSLGDYHLGDYNWTFIPHVGRAVASLATSATETTNNVFAKNHKWSVPETDYNAWVFGAVGIMFGQYTSTNDLFTNNGVHIDANTPLSGYGGWVTGEGGAVYGDGIGVVLNIYNGTFLNNTAGFGGGLSIYGSCRVNDTYAPSVLTVADSRFVGNRASGIGGAFNSYGAQISLNVSTSIFSENGAYSGGAIDAFCHSYPSQYFTDNIFDSNYATFTGGALTTEPSGGNFYFDSLQITNNYCAMTGGGISLQAGDWAIPDGGIPESLGIPVNFTFVNTNVVNNTAGIEGGGISGDLWPAEWELPRLNFTIYLDESSSVTDNTAVAARGGGINMKANRPFHEPMIIFDGTTVINNSPDDIHANDTGLITGTLATFAQAVLGGNPALFALGPSDS